MLGSRFSAIEELSLGPLRAKMTEKVKEVDRAIVEVKSLAQTLITPVVTMGMRIGRWDSALSRKEAHDLAKSTETILRRLAVPEDEISKSLEDFYKYTLFDMCRPIGEIIRRHLEPKIKQYEEETKKFGSPIVDIEGHRKAIELWRSAIARQNMVLSLTKIENIPFLITNIEKHLQTAGLLNEAEQAAVMADLKPILEEADYFVKNRTFKNPEEWFRGKNE